MAATAGAAGGCTDCSTSDAAAAAAPLSEKQKKVKQTFFCLLFFCGSFFFDLPHLFYGHFWVASFFKFSGLFFFVFLFFFLHFFVTLCKTFCFCFVCFGAVSNVLHNAAAMWQVESRVSFGVLVDNIYTLFYMFQREMCEHVCSQ